ncbi:NUDIX hydrolase [Streptomyces tsukubensis]|uniref:NUDIX hydrolase n=1 Tax=Streptomyces tsukubensis TaxID=83656 RepID=UPI003695A27C
MAITADHIRTVISAYLDDHPEEKPDLTPALALLATGADLTSRKEFRGHATAGAVLVGGGGRVLQVHHLATGKWLLPGGHLEAGDTTLLAAALRELTEETGVPADAVTPVGDGPLHIDIHPIDANPAKGEPGHQHIDFRFLFTTTADIGALQAEEVADAAWRPVDELHDEQVRQRIAQALRRP